MRGFSIRKSFKEWYIFRMARKRLIAGNWKMYIEDAEDAHTFAVTLRRKLRGLTGVDVWIAPPTPFIADVAKLLESSPIKVGTQKVTHQVGPKSTGSISAKMLKSVGASFVIVGHSEYRSGPGTNDKIRAQLERTVEAGLIPVLCIGEKERGQDGEHFSVIEEQLTSALQNFPKNLLKKLVVAYEPVWAIGKSAEFAMKPADIQETTIFIRKVLADLLDRKQALKLPILYGAAVEAENAASLIKEGGVQGLLVGHASAQLDEFLAIIQATRN
jgi:triosephosphate isomerase